MKNLFLLSPELCYQAFCRFLQLLSTCVRDFGELRQFLPLVPWDNVSVQVENLLSRRVPVLLDDGDSVGFRGVLNGDGGSLDDIVDVGDEVVGHVVNSLIMLSGNNERMSLVKRS